MEKSYNNYNDNYNYNNNTEYVDYELPEYTIFILFGISLTSGLYSLCKHIVNNCIKFYIYFKR